MEASGQGPLDARGDGPGESVAVNGCCLTAVAHGRATVDFDVLEETRRLTNLHSIAPGAPVNLERSMRADGRMGGHFVTGHVDGTGAIEAFEARGQDHYLRIRGPEGCGRLIVMKGSIAVDGISLTVAEVDGDAFAVWIIPHTLSVTNLRARRVGERVNLEFDMLGKYVEKSCSTSGPRASRLMRLALNAITDELRRLKAGGVESVCVSEEGMAALRGLARSRRPGRRASPPRPRRPGSARSRPRRRARNPCRPSPSSRCPRGTRPPGGRPCGRPSSTTPSAGPR